MPDKELYDAIDRADKRKLYREFFTVKEITEIDSAVTPDGETMQEIDIESDVWKAVRARRRAAVLSLRSRGFSDIQIRIQFNKAVKMKGAPTPFELLRAEYGDEFQPEKKDDRDYQTKVKKIKEKINKFYGSRYFKDVAIKQPKYKPVRRKIVLKAVRKGDVYR